ncbi:Flp family type IVb pilin [Thioalkalivibrio sp. ALJT]|uniref:Flp family type IVb pilin n=1 Tax=Thioalkalivibrio sp. ALJT TaxID=1158146 RepID=UPI000361B991|nr:Flp family type IVb pilin [Thioalkalivibrio sp. ALJT]
MKDWIRNLWNDEEGASAIEYALIAALIAVAIVTVAGLVGDDLVEVFEDIRDGLAGGGE